MIDLSVALLLLPLSQSYNYHFLILSSLFKQYFASFQLLKHVFFHKYEVRQLIRGYCVFCFVLLQQDIILEEKRKKNRKK